MSLCNWGRSVMVEESFKLRGSEDEMQRFKLLRLEKGEKGVNFPTIDY